MFVITMKSVCIHYKMFKKFFYIFEIIKEGIFALDKPYGLPCIGGPKVNLSVSKLLPLLEEKLNIKNKLLMCHRLDEYTTGVMLFAT